MMAIAPTSARVGVQSPMAPRLSGCARPSAAPLGLGSRFAKRASTVVSVAAPLDFATAEEAQPQFTVRPSVEEGMRHSFP